MHLPEETSCVPLERNEARKTLEVCPSNVFKHVPSEIDHIFIVVSPDDVNTQGSTGENSTDQIPLL